MKIVRYKIDKSIKYGALSGNEVIELRGSVYSMFRQTFIKHSVSDIQILCPVKPNQIWGPKYNLQKSDEGYITTEYGLDPWLKGSNAICGPNESIVIENNLFNKIGVTSSLVAVIGKQCKKINSKNISKYILGYTCGIDVASKRTEPNKSTRWRAKSSDNFSPVGPYLETEFDVQRFSVAMDINGSKIQRFTVADLPYSPYEIVSQISQEATLQPGDLVFLGGPEPYTSVQYGDEVSCSIEGIGVLHSRMVEEYVSKRPTEVTLGQQTRQRKLVI